MNTQLSYMVVRHRNAELRNAGMRARLAREMHTGRPTLPDPDPIAQVSAKPGRQSARTVTALELERPMVGTR